MGLQGPEVKLTATIPFVLPNGEIVSANQTFWYVDSNCGGGADGQTWSTAFRTLAAAEAAAGENDVILVAEGHSETVSTGITIDVAGLRIIGCGNGKNRPQLTGYVADDIISVEAANVLIYGLHFPASTLTGVTSRINVAGANCSISDCYFECGQYDLESITLAAAGDYCTIERCKFDITANGPDAAIEIEDASVDNLIVRDCVFCGGNSTNKWDASAINSDVIHTNCTIYDNVSDFGVFADFDESATGVFRGNVMTDIGGTIGNCLDPGYCATVQNYAQVAVDTAATVLPAVGTESIGTSADTETDTLHGKIGTDTEMADASLFDLLVTPTGAINDTVTSTLHGKIGTDTEMADSSLYDLVAVPLGTINATTTDSVHGKIGTDTEMADSSLYDLLVVPTGAINDTETSTLHGKIGTDTEMADASLYDLLVVPTGAINDTETSTLHGKIGTDTEMADSSLYDLLVVPSGAVNDTETSTLHGKIGTDTELADSSLFDILCGGAGVPGTFPTAAAAANGVSLAEVLRYLSEKQTRRIVLKSTGSMATGFGVGDSPKTLFTVTGDCLVRVGASVDVAVTSTSNDGTLEVGVAGNTAALCVQDVADATAFAIGDSWSLITAADANGAQMADEWLLVGNGVDIILTIGVHDMTAGDIDFYCEYIPLSSDGAVVAA